MIALFGLYLLCGCEDALTVKPENSLTYENGLSTPKDFESFINGIDKALKTVTYMNEPNLQIKKGVYVDEYYDDSEMEWAQTLSYPSSELSYWNTRSWQMYYEPIASANVVLTYADAADLSSERRDLYKGQAWFYKALLYLEIIHQWGDCMLIRDQVELLPTAKTAWDEVADYAIDMATKAAEALPEFDKIRMANGNTPKRIGIIHCVGSRDEKVCNYHCSKLCCITGVKQAIELRELLPDTEIFCFYMDMRMFGPGYEEMYREAQEKYNIKFVRGRLSEAAENMNKQLQIKVEDTLVGKPLRMTLDMMILLVGMESSEGSRQMAETLGLNLAPNGFIKSQDPHYRNNNTNVEGVFVAGCGSAPMNLTDTLADARSAAMNIIEYVKLKKIL